MAESRPESRLGPRLPLAEIAVNSPKSAVGKHHINDNDDYFSQAHCEGVVGSRVQELRDTHSRPASPLFRRHNSTFDFDIHTDADEVVDQLTTTSIVEPHTDAICSPDLNIQKTRSAAQITLQSNLTPRAEQTRRAEPMIKSHSSQLFSAANANAQSPAGNMADTPGRQQSLDTNPAASPRDMNGKPPQQQGQGEQPQVSHTPTKASHGPTIASAPPQHSTSHTMPANMPAKRSASNKENIQPKSSTDGPHTPLKFSATAYDALEAAVVEAATPPVGHSTSQSPLLAATKHDLPAIEKLEIASPAQAVSEEVIPKPSVVTEPAIATFAQSLVEKSQQPTNHAVEDAQAQQPTVHAVKDVQAQQLTSPCLPSLERPLTATSESKTRATNSPPRAKKNIGPRPTKASLARISLAHDGDAVKAPAWGRPRQISDQNSRLSINQRALSNGSDASTSDVKKEISIPHSKPRPMSMSFPAPAPLVKSAKLPTRPTFQLPGEAVAQKLKEARELREKKDDDKKVFKARPVPASTKAAPLVRATNTSKARESLGLGKELTAARTGPLHSRASSVAVVRSSDRKSSISSRATSSGSDKPSTFGVSGRLYNPQRASSSMANISKPRDASPADIAAAKTGLVKKAAPVSGKEVYHRHIFASDAAEREKREKEEATKRARAEAAERSRLLSREWAAKKRQQQLTAAKAV